jgi:2'-5' RNA ligase
MAGMIALVPDDDSVNNLAVDGGEDPDQLHATLLHLGDDDDVNGWSDDQRANLGNLVANLAAGTSPVDGHIIGPAHFNPDGGTDGTMDPCVVHLVGGTGQLGELRDYLSEAINGSQDYPDLPSQHPAYLPHVTAGYGLDPSAVSYAGPVRFDKLRYAVGDDVQDYPFGIDPDGDGDDDSTPEGDTDHDVWPDEEKSACGQLCTDMDAELYAATHHVETKTARCRHNELGVMCENLHPGIEHRYVTAPEVKVASPDPRAAKLRRYWAFNPKATAKWRPGQPHDFYRLRRLLSKYVQDPHILSGLTANIHKMATGFSPGHEPGHKALPLPMLGGDENDPTLFDPGAPDDDESGMFDDIDPVALLLVGDDEMDEFGDGLPDEDDDDSALDGVPEPDADDGPVVEADQGMRIKSAEVVITPLELKILDQLAAEVKAAPGSLDDLMLETDRLGLLDVSAAGDQISDDGQSDSGDEDWGEVLKRDKRWLLGANGDLVDGGAEQGKNTQDDDNGLGSNGTVSTAQTSTLNMPASLFDGI